MNEREIFAAALEKRSAAERAAFLDGVCGADAALRERIEALLAEQAGLGSFLESPPAGVVASAVATIDQPLTERPGTQIGPYKLLQQIGEGGMGMVYMAEQSEPVQRKVALKVIKPGMDSRQVIARFEAEKQALAMMDHVNIARVLDAGTTEQGRPYFVMELVHGIPITKYCDDNRLAPRQRLELFVPVCQAIQHAHQKGIIHRDIKPTNVMVTLYDGQPVPKVIDFGVAKATEQKLTERTLFTQYGTMVGTLEYMSPEQAEMSALGVDTRSDIYSLGVLLYELLTGSTPLSSKRMKEAAYAEILRMIKEEEPLKPSTRLSESGEALASISAQRHMEPAKLTKLMRGELDWIVMKTLDKDRNRRYETAKDFAADVQRYLDDEQVQACPPSAWYRFRKFTRRNKAALIAASVVAAALLLGLVGTTWQAIRATHAEGVAQVQRDRAVEAEKVAKTEAAIAQAVNDFLNNDVLAQANPQNPIGRYNEPAAELKLLTVLDRADAKIEGRFRDQPLVEAALRHTIGYTYANLHYSSRCQLNLQRAVDLRREHLGEEHPDTLASMADLAWAKEDPALTAKVLEVQRRVLGKDHPATLSSMFSLALMIRNGGERTRAIELLRETLEAQRRMLGVDDPSTAWTMHCLAHTLVMSAGAADTSEAEEREIEPMYRQALAVYRQVYGDSWRTYDITLRLGQFLRSRHRYEEAESLLQDGVVRLQALPAAPPQWAKSLAGELDAVYRSWGQPERAAEWERKRAAPTTQQTLEIALRAVELEPKNWIHWQTLALAHYRAGNWSAALAALDRMKELGASADRANADRWTWFLTAMAHWQLGEQEEARGWYGHAVDRMATDAQNEEFRRFRAEAAELLGVKEKKD